MAVIYVAIAWALIEASSVIFPALSLPEWTVTFVVIIALLGFPVMLICSWVFDITREGVVRTPGRQELPPDKREKFSRGRVIDFVIIAALLGIIGWLAWDRLFDQAVPDAELVSLDSIAVLPFVNMSGDAENEYFGDGLAEEILNALTQVEGLRVAARTSSFEYKGRNIDVRRIGEALNVKTVLEGSVRKAGGQVRIVAQLIRTDDGFHLWSATFDRQLEDIFALQDEISLSIVDALRLTLGGRERERVTARPTTNVYAFEAYLRGRFEMQRRSAASLRRAIDHFKQAIEHDPNYAAAYSGLSDTWLLRASYGMIPNEEAVAEAEPLAMRALELDPDLAEAHASWGLVLFMQGELEDSIEPLLRAIELNPSYSPAYHWLGLSYHELLRFEEAAAVLRKAIEVDPHYVIGKLALLKSLRSAGQDEQADALVRDLVQAHSDEPLVLSGLANDSMSQGRRVESVRYLARAISLEPGNPTFRINMAYALLNLGDLDRAKDQIDILRRLNPEHPALPQIKLELMLSEDIDGGLERAIQEIDAMEPGSQHDKLACSLLPLTDRSGEAVDACMRQLDVLGWQPGEPLTAVPGEVLMTLMMAAMKAAKTEQVDAILEAFLARIERMEKGGMRPDEVKWNRALIDAHAKGQTDQLIEVLPAVLATAPVNLDTLVRLPLFEPIHDDPRFHAIIEDMRAELHRDREAIQEIEIPDP